MAALHLNRSPACCSCPLAVTWALALGVSPQAAPAAPAAPAGTARVPRAVALPGTACRHPHAVLPSGRWPDGFG